MADDIKVFISGRESTCDECKAELGHHAWITLHEDKTVHCLSCSDLDHLVFLPSGDTALTRRSRKYSSLVAVVLKWSKARKRYERQGLLVDNEALERAEEECSADADVREIRRGQAALRRAELDQDFITKFAARVRELYPHCPANREKLIAEHACRKYSGRVGRCAAAKQLDRKAVKLAVIAHIRHAETNYDELLALTKNKQLARHEIQQQVSSVQAAWM